MDFSSLPDNVFLKIFHYLPFRKQIRVSDVSVAFRRMSDIVISETKSLDLNDVALKNISPFRFSRLLNLCQGGLTKCNLVGSIAHGTQYHSCMADAFNQYTYPQLDTLSFDDYYDCVIDISLRKCASNLESLSIKQINFPDVIMERLETLDCSCDDGQLETLVGKMPNLKLLNLRDDGFAPATLDRFLGTVPQMESFRIHIVRFFHPFSVPLDLEGNDMTAFWQLKSLNRFELSYGDLEITDRHHVIIDDGALIRLAQSFPRLSVLSLCCVKSGNDGVAALSSLQLRELTLEEVEEDINAGLRELSKCECLEKLVVISSLEPVHWMEPMNFSCFSADTASTLLRSCPRLTSIACRQLVGIETEEDAVVFIASLHVLEKRAITIRFSSCGLYRIWTSASVKNALKVLDEGADVVVDVLWGF